MDSELADSARTDGMLADSARTDGMPMGGVQTDAASLPLAFYEENGVRVFDWRPMIRALVAALDAPPASDSSPGGVAASSPSALAFRFMDALCQMALEQCIALNPKRLPVVLSGGVFQNRFLLSRISELLTKAGFSVYCHRRVSANDEGLCLGQLAIGAAWKEEHACVLQSQ